MRAIIDKTTNIENRRRRVMGTVKVPGPCGNEGGVSTGDAAGSMEAREVCPLSFGVFPLLLPLTSKSPHNFESHTTAG